MWCKTCERKRTGECDEHGLETLCGLAYKPISSESGDNKI